MNVTHAFRWGLGFSLGLHALALAGLLLVRPAPVPRHDASPIDLVMMPSEAAVATQAPEAEQAPLPAVPPPPEPVEAAPAPVPVPDSERPPLPPAPRREPAPRPVRRPAAELRPQARASAPQAKEQTGPPSAPIAPVPQAAQQEEMAHADAAWMAEVGAWLRANLTYPNMARRLGQEGTVVLQVTIDREGHVLDAVLAQGSGFGTLDQAGVALVRGARLPPFPPGMKLDRQSVKLPIHYRLE